jgi:hypothetical protein
MGNIKNFNFNKLDVLLSNSDYWDFYLANDDGPLHQPEICTALYFDFNNLGIFTTGSTSANTIASLVSWTGATNTGYTFNTIGLTGIDNGLVPYVKSSADTTNQALLLALTGTTLYIPSGDPKFYFTRISGSTSNFVYPINFNTDYSGQYAEFNGGFYQGYYKIDGSTYQVLPTRVPQAWTAQFWVKKRNDILSAYTSTTLNSLYPNNKGFFFYMGTRAENKFWNNFSGLNTGCTSACTADINCTGTVTNYCTIPKENQVIITGVSSADTFTLYPNQVNVEVVTNPFLLYGRVGNSGYYQIVCPSCGGPSGLGNQIACVSDNVPVILTTPKTVVSDTRNPFLVYGRVGNSGYYDIVCPSCGGPSGLGTELACVFSGFEKSIQYENLDYNLDLIDNAIGFRIKDDGSIGYRLMTYTGYCSGTTYISGATIEEGYSASGMVQDDVWTNIVIRYSMYDSYNYCDLETKGPRLGRLSFYINGRLKYFVDDFKEFIGKRLNDYWEKQVGVPFNISLGGGSQGLIESQTFDGPDPQDAGLPIEQNFAGSFIGDISQFKFNLCDLYFDDIDNIYSYEVARYTD